MIGICTIEYIEIEGVNDFPFSDFLTPPPVRIPSSKLGYHWKRFKHKGKIPDVEMKSNGDYYEVTFTFDVDGQESTLPKLNNKKVLLRLATGQGEHYLLGLNNQPVTLLVSNMIVGHGGDYSSYRVSVEAKQVFFPATLI